MKWKMGWKMDIRRLEYFVTLANVLNYTKASELLFISQPSLSRHISSIEEELGCKLFVRNTHQVELTAEGRNFFLQAAKIVLLYKKGVSDIRLPEADTAPPLKLAFLRGGTEHQLVPILSDFQAGHPQVRLKCEDHNHPGLIESLHSGRQDIVFTLSNSFNKPDMIKTIDLIPLRSVLVVRSDHPLAKRQSVSIHDFYQEPLVFVSRGIARTCYDSNVSFYMSNGYTPYFAEECASVTSLLLLVALGRGVTILTESCQTVAPDNLRLIPIENAVSPIFCASYAVNNSSPALRVFVAWLLENRHHYIKAAGA